ncbi:MAG: hypothetical protein ACXAD7_19355 [Candidatus Kariarchaeaceae archaeon]|jgi:hypothetical protein
MRIDIFNLDLISYDLKLSSSEIDNPSIRESWDLKLLYELYLKWKKDKFKDLDSSFSKIEKHVQKADKPLLKKLKLIGKIGYSEKKQILTSLALQIITNHMQEYNLELKTTETSHDWYQMKFILTRS